MIKNILLCIFVLATAEHGRAQTTPNISTVIRQRVNLNDKVIKDSSGAVLPPEEWHKRLASGYYKFGGSLVNSDTLTLVRMTADDIARRNSLMTAPPASPIFPAGEKKALPKLKDINGNTIDFKALEGKVVVLNFWFIACEPCKEEIPELNKLAAENPDVVFVAIGLDLKYEIKDFLKTNAFGYQQAYDGREYCKRLGISGYPTNVVMDKKGITRFSSTGYGPGTLLFLKNALKQAKAEN